jgi:plastocyanin
MRKTHLIVVALCLLAACATPPAASQQTSAPASQETATAEPTPTASVDPLAACEGVEPTGEMVEIPLGTTSYAFDPRDLAGPTHCQPFAITFTNTDAKAPLMATNKHNVALRVENLIGSLVYLSNDVGQTTVRWEVPGLPAGVYYMYCTLHAGMSGELVVAEG